MSARDGLPIRNCPLWTYILAEAALNQEPVKEDVTITTPRLVL